MRTVGRKVKNIGKPKKPKSTTDQFTDMVGWVMKDMDKEPRNDREMFAQSFGAVGKTMILIAWIYGKTLGFLFSNLRRLIRMVFGKLRRKKDGGQQQPADQVAFVPPALLQQYQQQMAQQPVQQPAPQPVAQPSPVAIPAEFPAQPVVPPTPPAPPASQPAQPLPQPELVVPPLVRPADRPAPPETVDQKPSVQELSEQLMQSFISIGENIKTTGERLVAIESYLRSIDQQIDDLYARMNMVQGIQPKSKQRTKFTK